MEKRSNNPLFKTTDITEWQETGVQDVCLCHDTSGIAHIYNRAYKLTGIEKFRLSSIYWIEQSLKMAVFDAGFAGYKTYYQNLVESVMLVVFRGHSRDRIGNDFGCF